MRHQTGCRPEHCLLKCKTTSAAFKVKGSHITTCGKRGGPYRSHMSSICLENLNLTLHLDQYHFC
uniref:Uncharacterized protein n=1 Tax=Anguilla anguilla TaxID=7936 RepID=A0A0E9WJW1_ANGAN